MYHQNSQTSLIEIGKTIARTRNPESESPRELILLFGPCVPMQYFIVLQHPFVTIKVANDVHYVHYFHVLIPCLHYFCVRLFFLD